jgi:hypothetical protein
VIGIAYGCVTGTVIGVGVASGEMYSCVSTALTSTAGSEAHAASAKDKMIARMLDLAS